MVGMRADVADAAAGTGVLVARAPSGLLLATGLESFGQPVLRIFDLYDTQLAKLGRGKGASLRRRRARSA